MKIWNSFLVVSILTLASCATNQTEVQPLLQKRTQAQSSTSYQETINGQVVAPVKLISANIVLKNEYYTINYNAEKNIANYSDYLLTGEMLSTHVETKRNYKPDVRLKEYNLPIPTTKWYVDSGYDRGHLTPLEDMGFSIAGFTATNLMSNITPQERLFNSPAWSTLERVIRNWGCKEGAIRVVTGTIFNQDLGKVNNEITIPSHFYKAILDLTPPRKAIAFVMSQKDRGGKVYLKSVKTVREVEEMVGYDIFDDIQSPDQEQLENRSDINDWRERLKICYHAGYRRFKK